MDFPWLVAPLRRFVPRDADLPHALLLHGHQGIGKRILATAIARTLLCEAAAADRVPGGCGACRACHWFDESNHPDYRLVTTEALALESGVDSADAMGDDEGTGAKSKRAPSREIKVDQIRALLDFLVVATHRGHRRVVQVQPLDAMNDIASNALLKMLEEPPSHTVFIASTDHLGRIQPTIRSRCQALQVAGPTEGEAVAWLERAGVASAREALAAAGGAPLTALAAAGDDDARSLREALVGFLARPDPERAMAMAESLAKGDANVVSTWMQQWISDCITLRLAGRVRYHPARFGTLADLVRDVTPDRLMDFSQRLASVRRAIDHPLNQRLMFESLFLAYCDAVRRSDAIGTDAMRTSEFAR